MIPYLVMAAVVGVVVVIFVLFRTRKSSSGQKTPAASTGLTTRDETAAEPGRREKLPCPLCGSRLYNGDRIRTVAFDMGKEKFMQIYGCRHCDSAAPSAQRRCPVCRRQIPEGGFVVGRMWEKYNKTRLHISGCTECRPQYK